jgi:NAD(P)-dependent dehydrogenase (short-subunit alcohol dehydrogenase family)
LLKLGNNKAHIQALLDANKALLAEVLQGLADHPELAEEETRLKSLIAKIGRSARKQNRALNKEITRQEDAERIAASALFQLNDELHAGQPLVPSAIEERELSHAKSCYICKAPFKKLHAFYHQLCPTCAAENYARRTAQADLSGRIALVTGGRIKIGFEIALKLLRWGARVIITTRFPANALSAFRSQPDAAHWLDRLEIVGLDLRNLQEVEELISRLHAQLPHLDLLIHNAAQTVKRPIEFYAPLLAQEQGSHLLEERTSILPGLPSPHFPSGKVDLYGQPADLRPQNSWMQSLEEVPLLEMLEVQLVNVTAPFRLNSALKPLLDRSPFERKFIVNVSAMEGIFNRAYKSPHHPHTNMAKAALNMMTRTSAADYAKSGIYMTSVDTGWITDENPAPKKEKLRQQGFVPPLDVVDGAARVLAPIVDGINLPETPVFGVFLKDYKISPW